MRYRTSFAAALAVPFLIGGLLAYQKPFREYPAVEYYGFPLPPDSAEKTEWVFGRLIYPAVVRYPRWTMDYPRSDRHFSAALRRLTRVHARSVEQPIDLDDGDDVFNWPFLYGVEVGYWDLTDAQCKKMREFLLRGGFFMCDDFHGTREWSIFMASMSRIFPDRRWWTSTTAMRSSTPSSIWTIATRFRGRSFSEPAGFTKMTDSRRVGAAFYDDKGGLHVAICHNMDLGDSWEHADNPQYPESIRPWASGLASTTSSIP